MRKPLAKHWIWLKSLRGDLQMHTHWSDGSASVKEMAESAARARLRIYCHHRSFEGAENRRLESTKARLAQQGEEIDALNQSSPESGLTVLRSIELNLNPRGQGDVAPAALARLDLVLGSFHSSLRTTEDQTERYLAAIRNPCVHIHGHPRGRIYNYRLGLRASWSRVFAEAARLDKAVEIDCYPDRQDLNAALLQIARREGTRISLGTDAHHAGQFGFIELGLAAALKAKIPAERIINFMPLSRLLAWACGVGNGATG